jgi:hypothetical protein
MPIDGCAARAAEVAVRLRPSGLTPSVRLDVRLERGEIRSGSDSVRPWLSAATMLFGEPEFAVPGGTRWIFSGTARETLAAWCFPPISARVPPCRRRATGDRGGERARTGAPARRQHTRPHGCARGDERRTHRGVRRARRGFAGDRARQYGRGILVERGASGGDSPGPGRARHVIGDAVLPGAVFSRSYSRLTPSFPSAPAAAQVDAA